MNNTKAFLIYQKDLLWSKYLNQVWNKSLILEDVKNVVFFFYSLPKVVKRRVNALKNLQVKCAHIEAKFYEEVHELERKYAALYQPLFDKVCHLHASSRLSDTKWSILLTLLN